MWLGLVRFGSSVSQTALDVCRLTLSEYHNLKDNGYGVVMMSLRSPLSFSVVLFCRLLFRCVPMEFRRELSSR
ncbi:unnamed protein product [Brassica napus]|uniref:(rape) hypothetical protein n=1 Tax=Brassica napus TaxID=3708 RepID=A0A816PFF8_BRANA|nr:unnamed protein product [Brassica napus]